MARHFLICTPTAAASSLFAVAILATVAPGMVADVTPDRLANANKEPQNWLMNHRTYDGQRFSPLARINRENVKSLKIVYAIPLGGSAGDEWIEATPLAENGFLYITDAWGVLYKIDATSGDNGRVVWRMEPKQEKQSNNRGAALWRNLVISPANWPARIMATDKETGKVVWETNMLFGQPETRITAAPLVINDKIIVGASGGDSGVRDWVAALDAASGRLLWRKFTIPATCWTTTR
jgi:alcohol dehydrogenase (cytochrome c)